MPSTNSFDLFFQNFPPLNRAEDYIEFWKRSISELKRISIDPTFEKEGGDSGFFDIINVSFRGYLKSRIRGKLYLPKHIEKPRVIISIPDYNLMPGYEQYPLDKELAFFFLELRGHDILNTITTKEEKLPGFILDNILVKDSFYVKSIYLDVYRIIDLLRLYDRLDCNSIGLIGKGLGAAAGLFATVYSDRIKAIVLDTPSFCHLELSQNISKSDTTKEINQFLSNHRGKKKIIKKNLSYFDAINLAEEIICPTLVTVGLKDILSPPQCVFALFNHLVCDKTVEVYPEGGNEAGGKMQFTKSIQWLKARLLDL
ncbi:MAG: acetylxylan esterase [Spirochaetota bacterium]|nr:acetylxylan esterase [Spirochaetota bacterium]